MNTLHGLVCIIGLLLAVSAEADPNLLGTQGRGANSVYTDQSGSTGGSVIDIYQVGGGTEAGRNYAGTAATRIVQTGSHGTARIGQGATYGSTLSETGVWGGSGTWTETPAVQSNQAIIQQSGNGQRAEVYQTGDGNTATVIQSGAAAQATRIVQDGAEAQLSATQAGSAANVLIATQTASGAGLTATVEQNGSGTANLTQSGEHSSINVVNQTGGVANLNQQGILGGFGYGNSMTLSNQSGHTVTLIQHDNNRTVNVDNPATNMTITQCFLGLC